MWYTKREQSVLTSLWYCMTGVQLMVRLNSHTNNAYHANTKVDWRPDCLWNLPLRKRRHQIMATPLPRSWSTDLRVGGLYRMVAARLPSRSQVFLRG